MGVSIVTANDEFPYVAVYMSCIYSGRPVDTRPTPLSGRVVGEYDSHFAILLDIGLVWDFLKE